MYGMFYNIADGSGSGDDHCELVGGTTSTAIESPDYNQSPDIQGNQTNVSYFFFLSRVEMII